MENSKNFEVTKINKKVIYLFVVLKFVYVPLQILTFFVAKLGLLLSLLMLLCKSRMEFTENTIFCLQLSSVILTLQFLSVSAVKSMTHPSPASDC
jgi:hypothetical protein